MPKCSIVRAGCHRWIDDQSIVDLKRSWCREAFDPHQLSLSPLGPLSSRCRHAFNHPAVFHSFRQFDTINPQSLHFFFFSFLFFSFLFSLLFIISLSFCYFLSGSSSCFPSFPPAASQYWSSSIVSFVSIEYGTIDNCINRYDEGPIPDKDSSVLWYHDQYSFINSYLDAFKMLSPIQTTGLITSDVKLIR